MMEDYNLCVYGSIDGKQVKMTEDHRISSFSERLRMQEVGAPLKDGETRICGDYFFSFLLSVATFNLCRPLLV